MHRTSSLGHFFLDHLARSLLASAGILLFAFGFYLQLVANIGLSPWQALNQGLSIHLSMTLGQASILVSLMVVATDLLLREPIGFGTILDALLTGWGTDLFIRLDLIPYQNSFLPGLAILLLSIVVTCVAQYIFMKAALSCGPRDALMVAIGKRIRRVSIGTVNILMTAVVLAAGWLLGGTVGVGTVVSLFGTGIIMDLVFHILRFEPRDVAHEGLAQTISAFRAALHADKATHSH